MTKRFVIVEGGDGAGKTTLVEELSEVLRPQGWDTKNLVHRPGNQFQRYLLEYTTADRVIFNRSHYAELVYGQRYRGAQPFSAQELQALETIVQTYGVIVYCDLPVAECLTRVEKRNLTEVLSTDDSTFGGLLEGAAAFEAVFQDRHVIRYSAYAVDDLKVALTQVRDLVLEG